MTMRGEAVPQGRRGDLDGARAVAIAVALAATLTAGFAAGRLSVPDVGSADAPAAETISVHPDLADGPPQRDGSVKVG
jgi:hypothetical protein